MHETLPLLRPVPPPAAPVPFALAGWGWRARQFAEIARLLPGWFRLTAILRRTPDGAEPAPVVRSLAELRADPPAFLVVAVPRATAPDLVRACAAADLPVLLETPPAADLDALRALWRDLAGRARVQVAEQYPAQPFHAALRTLIDTGLLGAVHHVQASIAHDYHGIAVIRHLLGVGRGPVRVRALEVDSPVIAGPGRSGPPTSESRRVSRQMLGLFDFGEGRSGVLDFVGDQYMSWIRGTRLLVRGERGEAADDRVSWLQDFRTPARGTITRHDGGQRTDLQGLAHQGYALGERWLYRNPFWPAPLPDDFIAMASALSGMGGYVSSGRDSYPLADGCHDHAVALEMARAAREGREIEIRGEPWMTTS